MAGARPKLRLMGMMGMGIPNIESPYQPVLDAGVADIVGPELEGIAASARDAA